MSKITSIKSALVANDKVFLDIAMLDVKLPTDLLIGTREVIIELFKDGSITTVDELRKTVVDEVILHLNTTLYTRILGEKYHINSISKE